MYVTNITVTSPLPSPSAPCRPESPVLSLNCSTNVVAVRWDNAGPDQGHVVTALDTLGGGSTTCNSSSSNCTFAPLGCGTPYDFSVTGYTDQCQSQPSVTLSQLTGTTTGPFGMELVHFLLITSPLSSPLSSFYCSLVEPVSSKTGVLKLFGPKIYFPVANPSEIYQSSVNIANPHTSFPACSN